MGRWMGGWVGWGCPRDLRWTNLSASLREGPTYPSRSAKRGERSTNCWSVTDPIITPRPTDGPELRSLRRTSRTVQRGALESRRQKNSGGVGHPGPVGLVMVLVRLAEVHRCSPLTVICLPPRGNAVGPSQDHDTFGHPPPPAPFARGPWVCASQRGMPSICLGGRGEDITSPPRMRGPPPTSAACSPFAGAGRGFTCSHMPAPCGGPQVSAALTA